MCFNAFEIRAAGGDRARGGAEESQSPIDPEIAMEAGRSGMVPPSTDRADLGN